MACRNGVCSRKKSTKTIPGPIFPGQATLNPTSQRVMTPNQGGTSMPQEKSFGQKVKEFFVGAPGGVERFIPFTPQQQQAYDQVLSYALQQLLGNNLDFGPLEEQARTKFYSQTVPSLAERFTAMGSGAQNSSAFQGVLGRAGSDLEQSLAALKSQYNLQRQPLLQNLLNTGLQPRFESLYHPGNPGLLQGISQGVGTGLGLLPSLFL